MTPDHELSGQKGLSSENINIAKAMLMAMRKEDMIFL